MIMELLFFYVLFYIFYVVNLIKFYGLICLLFISGLQFIINRILFQE